MGEVVRAGRKPVRVPVVDRLHPVRDDQLAVAEVPDPAAVDMTRVAVRVVEDADVPDVAYRRVVRPEPPPVDRLHGSMKPAPGIDVYPAY